MTTIARIFRLIRRGSDTTTELKDYDRAISRALAVTMVERMKRDRDVSAAVGTSAS
jgi:hypothetical protein